MKFKKTVDFGKRRPLKLEAEHKQRIRRMRLMFSSAIFILFGVAQLMVGGNHRWMLGFICVLIGIWCLVGALMAPTRL